MTQCECPLAGFCQRHQVTKPDGWHHLCQTRESYYAAWEAGRGPGQAGRKPKSMKRRSKKPPMSDEKKEARRKKVVEATRKKLQLIGWLKLLRSPQDTGIGDTANRIVQQKKKSKIWIASDAHDAVNCLLRQCSCSRVDAVARLNQQWPY